MNRDMLTLLGCSGSLALMLATGSAASADTATPQYENFVGSESSVAQPATSIVQVMPQYATLDENSDTVGDLAIAKFHCDCPACRMAIVQLVQTGQLAL